MTDKEKSEAARAEIHRLVKGWKVKFFLYECDNMLDYGLNEGWNTEADMPFIPRINETVWLTDRCYDELKSHVAKCWEEQKCGDCPFMYGGRKSVDDIEVGDCAFVKDIIYNLDDKEVLIALSNSPQKE